MNADNANEGEYCPQGSSRKCPHGYVDAVPHGEPPPGLEGVPAFFGEDGLPHDVDLANTSWPLLGATLLLRATRRAQLLAGDGSADANTTMEGGSGSNTLGAACTPDSKMCGVDEWCSTATGLVEPVGSGYYSPDGYCYRNECTLPGILFRSGCTLSARRKGREIVAGLVPVAR